MKKKGSKIRKKRDRIWKKTWYEKRKKQDYEKRKIQEYEKRKKEEYDKNKI